MFTYLYRSSSVCHVNFDCFVEKMSKEIHIVHKVSYVIVQGISISTLPHTLLVDITTYCSSNFRRRECITLLSKLLIRCILLVFLTLYNQRAGKENVNYNIYSLKLYISI